MLSQFQSWVVSKVDHVSFVTNLFVGFFKNFVFEFCRKFTSFFDEHLLGGNLFSSSKLIVRIPR